MTTELSAVQQHVDAARVLEIEQALLRIPSSAFEEHQIADHLAERMTDIGLEVTMMDVLHPFDPTITSRQPMGILRGTGNGPSLMLNGHMDPGVEMPGWSVDPTARSSRTAGCGAWAPMTTRVVSLPRSAASRR
jgi:acetylornithine deacetylase